MARGLVALAAALLLLVPAAPASAKSFTLPQADVTVRVASDGGINVREEITFDFFGPFSGGYRDIPLRDGDPADFAAKYALWREKFNARDDGNAAARVVDRILDQGLITI